MLAAVPLVRVADLWVQKVRKATSAFLAVVLLSIGAWVAFERRDGRALLVSGTVLMALAFFGERITEFVAKFGDKELQVRAEGTESALEQATRVADVVSEEVAALTDDPRIDADLRSRLEMLEADLELLHLEAERALEVARWTRPAPAFSAADLLGGLEPLESGDQYKMVSFPSPGGRLLVMRAALNEDPWPDLRCVVVDPQGWQHEATVQPVRLFGAPVYRAEFPPEFTRRGRVHQGSPGDRHEVGWFRDERRLLQASFTGIGVGDAGGP